ncbi:MAG: DNA-processing protein DprA, partial [Candidatus Omnitrophica bacterium]|nr:DNA-processing protein DprA [Candidatus Omnitrophota bacterium]
MEVREVLVGLNLIEGIGSRRVKKLLEFFGKPQEIAQASCERLYQAAGINRKTAQAIRSLRPRDVEGECRQAARRGLRIMTLVDEDYPALLKTIYDPPAVLYVKGSLNAEDERALALVGSRRASFYGRRQAGQFAGALSRYGFTIVSGLARGIDCCAHRGALASGGRTIAVMGSGFLHLYPAEHRELAEQISRQGAVITEYPLHTKPLPYYFPRRNRIISGLSWGVLVVEAARTSGALITADTALEQGREVF